jgi:energy-coupling factor transporter ATP-binding protein EcfA2
LRIHLKDFGGVRDKEIEFASDGITLIHGPNEAGKSSIFEAIDLLFTKPDSARSGQVLAARPVGRDVSPFVELEFTTGPCHLVYAKRWAPGAMTRLQMITPQPANLTGREAHDRVEQILSETLDMALFRALWYRQGAGLAQAEVGGSRSLASALDATTGSVGGGEAEENLWSRIEAERRMYFTAARGQPVTSRLEVARELARAEGVVAQFSSELESVESDVDHYAEIIEELTDLEGDLGEMRHRRVGLEESVGKIREIESSLELLAARRTAAEAGRDRATAAQEARTTLIEALAAAQRSRDDLVVESERDDPLVTVAEENLRLARIARDGSAKDAETTLAEAEIASDDVRFLTEKAELSRLENRWSIIEDAEQRRAESQAFVDTCRLDDAALKRIGAARELALTARATARADAALLRIEAIDSVDLGHGRGTLQPGEVFEESVIDAIEVSIADVARVFVRAGGGGRASQAEAEHLERRLSGLYGEYGIYVREDDDAFEVAQETNRRLRDAKAGIARDEGVIEQALAGFTREKMAAHIERSRAFIGDYLAQRTAEWPVPSTYTEAVELDVQRRETRERAQRESQQRSAEYDATEAEATELRNTAAGRKVRRETADTSVQTAIRALEDARTLVSDKEVDREVTEEAQAMKDAQEAHDTAKERLAVAESDRIRNDLDNLHEAIERGEKEISRLGEERTRIRARLEVVGERGLHEQLDQAITRARQLRTRKDRIDRLAAAAELLFTCFEAERDAAKRSYVEPFKFELDRLAEGVFGRGTSVQVSHEDLSIQARTVGRETVPFESLSAGAKEQLVILARLAAARIVASGEDGGVPVIFDDALGNSDKPRTARIAATLREASVGSQVIIITCAPERYRNIGKAREILFETTDS